MGDLVVVSGLTYSPGLRVVDLVNEMEHIVTEKT